MQTRRYACPNGAAFISNSISEPLALLEIERVSATYWRYIQVGTDQITITVIGQQEKEKKKKKKTSQNDAAPAHAAVGTYTRRARALEALLAGGFYNLHGTTCIPYLV